MSVAWPVLIPLTAGAISLALWRSRAAQRCLAIVSALALLLACIVLLVDVRRTGYVVLQVGNWPAPFGISLVADLLGATMALLTAIVAVAVVVYSLGSRIEAQEKFGYYPLLHILLGGVCGAFLTGDIFNLYVWFEVLLIASFALLTLGGERAQMEGAIKYVTLNVFSSAVFLSAVGILYGLLGTLNMADLAAKVATVPNRGVLNVLATMFMIAFGIKAAAFPLFFWLPASYHTPVVAVSALFAGLLTKVGVYALFRVFTLIFNHDTAYTHQILLWAGGLTMLTGVLGAAAQFEFRRILSFHIISQIGYMIMGLALFTPLALLGGVFYIVHHIIVKTNLFLISGVTERLGGSHDLAHLGGFYRARPGLALLFFIPAFSLAGMPPLSGFFAKLLLVCAAFEASAFAIAALALLVGLLTLYSMTKLWVEVFWKPAPRAVILDHRVSADRGLLFMYTAIVALAICTLVIGFYAQPLYDLAAATAQQLVSPQNYIQAVLGLSP